MLTKARVFVTQNMNNTRSRNVMSLSWTRAPPLPLTQFGRLTGSALPYPALSSLPLRKPTLAHNYLWPPILTQLSSTTWTWLWLKSPTVSAVPTSSWKSWLSVWWFISYVTTNYQSRTPASKLSIMRLTCSKIISARTTLRRLPWKSCLTWWISINTTWSASSSNKLACHPLTTWFTFA